MTVKFDGQVEPLIHPLIEDQFPEFYHEEGPVFVEFVKQYYKWLETESFVRKDYISPDKSTICVSYGNSQVVGKATSFNSTFSAGDKIAIKRGIGAEDEDYSIFTIKSISNNSHLVLEDDCLDKLDFECGGTNYAQVKYKPNPTYYNRRLLDIIDIDKTIDDFIVYFKQQFLNNIQLDTQTSTKTLVKNSLDLYRSKGTERGLKLLFRIAYGIDADIYYPHTDLFRLSDGDYFEPKYLEFNPTESSVLLANKEIRGVTSGATAFVDSVIRRTVNNKIIDVAYISAIFGNFQTGELVISTDGDVTLALAPTIIGSLNSIVLPESGQGTTFQVGDILDVKSNKGIESKAVVSKLANAVGVISVTLEDGGYGYTGNATAEVSNLVLTISGVNPNIVFYTSNAYIKNKNYFNVGEQAIQPKALITYNTANDSFTTENVYSYHANGDVDGTGYIYTIREANSTAGELAVSIISGNLETGNAIYTESNAVTANVNGYDDLTAVANVMGTLGNVVAYVNVTSGSTFIEGERVTSIYSNGYIGAVSLSGGVGTIQLTNNDGIYAPGLSVTGANSGTVANIENLTVSVGVKDVGNTFIATNNNYIYFSEGANGTVNGLSNGAGFGFGVSNNLLYTEVIEVDETEVIEPYANVALDAGQYNITAEITCNLINFPIYVVLDINSYTIGKVQALASINPGTGYNILPVVKLVDNITYQFRYQEGFVLDISNTSGPFTVGEVITQEATNGRGLVIEATNTALTIENLRFYPNNMFIATTNSTTVISGNNSGSTANIDLVRDIASDHLGYNAEFSLSAGISNNAVTELRLIDSGFGFVDGETVNVYSNSESLFGSANVSTHGTGEGFYKDSGGFLSDVKKLQDGNYWQQFSYEIRSSMALDKYEDVLRQVMHVAGVSIFSNLINQSTSDFDMSVSNTTIITE